MIEVVPDQGAQVERRAVRDLNRAQTRIPLILDLATGMSQYEAADKYAVHQSSISRFADRWAAEVRAQEDALEDQFAALWIAHKRIRIGVYQDDADAIDAHLAEMAGVDPSLGLDAALLRVKHAALRAVAEELGQLKTVIDATVSVRYEVVGVDVANLR